jgi:hypothetical protein
LSGRNAMAVIATLIEPAARDAGALRAPIRQASWPRGHDPPPASVVAVTSRLRVIAHQACNSGFPLSISERAPSRRCARLLGLVRRKTLLMSVVLSRWDLYKPVTGFPK